MAEKITIDIDAKINAADSIKDLKELKKILKETTVGGEDFKKVTAAIDDLKDPIELGPADVQLWGGLVLLGKATTEKSGAYEVSIEGIASTSREACMVLLGIIRQTLTITITQENYAMFQYGIPVMV
jgi:hypothetical protein